MRLQPTTACGKLEGSCQHSQYRRPARRESGEAGRDDIGNAICIAAEPLRGWSRRVFPSSAPAVGRAETRRALAATPQQNGRIYPLPNIIDGNHDHED